MHAIRVRNGRSRSSKVVHFCTNRKRERNFLLLNHSNVGRVSIERFRDIEVFSALDSHPTHIPTKICDVPSSLDTGSLMLGY